MKFAVCHPDRFIKGRGLCSTCYTHAYEQGRFPHRKARANVMGAINLGGGCRNPPIPSTGSRACRVSAANATPPRMCCRPWMVGSTARSAAGTRCSRYDPDQGMGVVSL